MARVRDIVTGEKFGALTPLQKMVSRGQLLDVELEENEELSAFWDTADDAQKHTVRENFRNNLKDQYPDVFKVSEGADLPVALLATPFIQGTIAREELDEETKMKILNSVSEGFLEMKKLEAEGGVPLSTRLNLNAQDAFFGLETGIGTALGAEFKAGDIGTNIFGRDKLVDAVQSGQLSLGTAREEKRLRETGERTRRTQSLMQAIGTAAKGLTFGPTAELMEARFGAMTDKELDEMIASQETFLEESTANLQKIRGEGLSKLARKVGAFIALPESEGFTENSIALLGQLAGSVPSPENLVGGIGGFASKSLFRGALIGAAENTVANIISEPFVQEVAEAAGQQEEFSFKGAVIRTAFGAALGGVFGAGSKLLSDFLETAATAAPKTADDMIALIAKEKGVDAAEAKKLFTDELRKLDPEDPFLKRVAPDEATVVKAPEPKKAVSGIAVNRQLIEVADTLSNPQKMEDIIVSIRNDLGEGITDEIDGILKMMSNKDFSPQIIKRTVIDQLKKNLKGDQKVEMSPALKQVADAIRRTLTKEVPATAIGKKNAAETAAKNSESVLEINTKIDEGRNVELVNADGKNFTPETANLSSDALAKSEASDASLKGAPHEPRTPSINGVNTKLDDPPRKDATLNEIVAVDPSEFMNVPRLNVSEEAQSIVEAQIKKTVAETGMSPKDVVSDKTIIAEAAALGIVDPKMIDMNLIQAMSIPARLAIRNTINAISNGLPDIYKRLDIAPTQQERVILRAQIAQAEFDLDQLIKINSGIRTADGRALASHRILADNIWDYQFWINKLKTAKGITEDIRASDPDAKAVTDIIKRGSDREATIRKDLEGKSEQDIKKAISDDADLKKTRGDLAKVVTDARETGWIDTMTNLFKAGLLSSVRTHARNVGGTAGFQVLDEVSRIPASLVDMTLALYSKERTVQGMSIKDFSGAALEGSKKGFKEAKDLLLGKSGFSDTELRRIETSRSSNFKKLGKLSPMVNAWINGNFKLLTAEDRFFKSIAADRSIREQANIISRNELKQNKITKDQFDARSKELYESPSDLMIAEAISAAEFMTFNNDGTVSQALANMKSTLRRGELPAQLLGAAFENRVPFSRTPVNLLARIFEATPVGAAINTVRAATAVINGTLTPAQQKQFAKAIGRGAPGTAIMILGAAMYRNGLATGQFNREDPMNDVYQAAGRMPGSVLVDGNWMQVVSFSPAGNLLALGAALDREHSRKIEGELAETKRIGNMMKASFFNILEVPVLAGLQDAVDSMRNPSTRFVRRLVNSYVPQIVNDVNVLFGGGPREKPKDAGILQQVKEGVQERLPFVNQGLEQKRLVTGEPVTTSKTFVIDPFLTRNARELEDKTIAELIRLQVPFRTLREKLPGESEADFIKRKVARGLITAYALDVLVNDPAYPSVPDEGKAEMLTSTIRQYTREVNSIMSTDFDDDTKLQLIQDIKVQFRELAPKPRDEGEPPEKQGEIPAEEQTLVK